MIFSLPNGRRVTLIGDPHLGKKFEVGVPLHRRGEREAMQLESFVSALAQDAEVVVMVGDLFDHPYVSYAALKQASDSVRRAALERPETTFYMLAGNHDVPRNITAIGAFHIFYDMVSDRLPNLWVVKAPIIADGLALFPWEWSMAALDQLPPEPRSDVYAAIGHWDLKSFGGSDRHLAPVDAIRARFGDVPIYSGHYHIAGDYPVEGGIVHCTGSLQPYAHDQDPAGDLYVTLPRSAVLSRTDLRDKVLRVLLQPGEDLPVVDCLALTHERLPPAVDEGASWSAPMAKTFDWQKTLASKLQPLDPTVRNFITERIPDYEQHGRGDQAAGQGPAAGDPSEG